MKINGQEYYTQKVISGLGRQLTLSEYRIKEECMSMGCEIKKTVRLIKESHEK